MWSVEGSCDKLSAATRGSSRKAVAGTKLWPACLSFPLRLAESWGLDKGMDWLVWVREAALQVRLTLKRGRVLESLQYCPLLSVAKNYTVASLHGLREGQFIDFFVLLRYGANGRQCSLPTFADQMKQQHTPHFVTRH
jgi:hypothetical protein